jgi:predicted glycoside hydrolase/deacetylase ChbG (UPF0249 family)
VHRGSAAADGDEPAELPATAAGGQRGRNQGRDQGLDQGLDQGRLCAVLAGVHATQLSAARQLAICCDDFGLHGGVNAAVQQLAEMGRVQATGCLVGGPGWAGSAPLLRRLADSGVEIGLHLDFTEFPLLAGSRRRLPGLILASLMHRLDRQALGDEIRAQLDAFERHLGRPPAFVDGHQHVHQLPQIRLQLLDELDRRYPAPRPWLRSTRAGPGAPPKARLIEALGAGGLAALARRRGYRQNRHLLGVYDFRGGAARYRELLGGWLAGAANADLLMCHPSLEWHNGDASSDARRAEFDVLSAAPLATLLERHALRLQPLTATLAAAPSGLDCR